MKFLTRSLTALATLTVGLAGSPVMAGEVYQDHANLWGTLQSVGVRTYLNPEQCWDSDNEGVSGFYVSTDKGHLVVCQDNKTEPNVEVKWTANDYDTLRHETVHLIQDCVDGVGDSSLIPILGDDLEQYVRDNLPPSMIERIIKVYGERGASDAVIINELEAFSMAASIHPDKLGEAVNLACGV